MSTICPLCQAREAKAQLYGEPICSGCQASFIVRRYFAFLFDAIGFSIGAFCLLVSIAVVLILLGGERLLDEAPPMTGYLLEAGIMGAFLLKDSFQGHSPGKWLFDLQVIDEQTGAVASWWQAVSRNIPLILTPAWVIMLFQIRRGPRWGDARAGTRVIWREYYDRVVFHPRAGLNDRADDNSLTPPIASPESDNPYRSPMG